MQDREKQALVIYETICATSGDRPYAFQSVAQMHRDVAAWQATNPGLTALRQASPRVQIAFLSHSLEWLRAASRDHSNFRLTSTLVDAVRLVLEFGPQPLPTEIVRKLFTELREDAITRIYFPFYQFLSVVTRDQITDEIRAELELGHST